MIDRDYVKLNTSIQTASNAKTLSYDEEGNVEAALELRLPENLFQGNNGTRTIQNVDMLATKFRLSMQNTPIAQIPVDQEESELRNGLYSACQLDVYPYSYLSNKGVKPTPEEGTDGLAFPMYKNKKYFIRIYLQEYPVASPETFDSINCRANDGIHPTNPFYPLLKKVGVNNLVQHPLNLVLQSNREKLTPENGSVFINYIGTVEQMLADALENAVTFAATTMDQIINVYLVPYENADWFSHPDVDKVNNVMDYMGAKLCFWKYELPTSFVNGNSLSYGFKPKVELKEQSLSISYDTAAFGDCVPILWNTPFIQTWSYPRQLEQSEYKSLWLQPPPKRQYKYGVNSTEATSFDFYLLDTIRNAPLNIIGNLAMKETFSFLPWITVDAVEVSNESLVETKIFTVRQEYVYSNAYTYDDGRIIYDDTNESAGSRVSSHFAGVNSTDTAYMIATLLDGTQIELTSIPAEGSYLVYTFSIKVSEDETYHNNTGYRRCQEARMGTRISTDTITIEPGGLLCTVRSPSTPATPSPTVIISEESSDNQELEEGTTIISTTEIPHITPETSEAFTGVYILRGRISGPAAAPWETVPAFGIGSGTWQTTFGTQMAVPLPGTVEPIAEERIHTYTYNDEEYYVYLQYWHYEDVANNTPNYYALPFGSKTFTKVTESRETQTTQEVVTLDRIEVDESKKDLAIPNLTLSDNKFYILDGSTCQVTIGSPEVVEIADSYQYTVNETVRSVTLERTVTKSGQGSEDHPNTQKTFHVTGAKVDIEGPTVIHPVHKLGMYLLHYQMSVTDAAYPERRHDPQYMHNVSVSMGQIVTTDTVIKPNNIVPQSYGPYHQVSDITTTRTYGDNSAYPPTGTTELEEEASWEEFRSSSLDAEVKTGWIRCTPLAPMSPARIINLYPFTVGDQSFLLPNEWWTDPDVTSAEVYTSPTVMDINVMWNLDIANEVGNYYEETSNTYTSYYTQSGRTDYITLEKSERDGTIKTGNVRLTFTWDNLPMVVMSPIQSLVLTMTGVQISHETQPINIPDAANPAASLTSVVPIVENYYSLATTLRDLHDELVVAKDSFDDCATYKMGVLSGNERVIHFSAKYITKDGSLHQIFIPKNGVFSLQVTFRIDYYIG